jgi:hypothetical protein
LIGATLLGITTWAVMPRWRAAKASAAPWLPDEWAATPHWASAAESRATALVAPRALKAPTFCRFSALRKIRAPAPAQASMASLVRTGVRCTRPAIRDAAARMSAMVTSSEVASALTPV